MAAHGSGSLWLKAPFPLPKRLLQPPVRSTATHNPLITLPTHMLLMCLTLRQYVSIPSEGLILFIKKN